MIAKLTVLTLAGAILVAGCHAKPEASPTISAPGVSAAGTSVKIVGVPDVARFLTDKSAVILDANGPDTRQEFGVVPGAVLLSSHKDYALSELPAAKATKLVFYCGGTMCRASDAAAERASTAGYTDVSVMRDGIKGWKDAHQPTETPRT